MQAWRFFSGLIVAASITAMATPGSTQSVYLFNIHGGNLTSSLKELAHQAGIELIFDPSLTEQRLAPSLDGNFSVAVSLTRLLAGTGLSFREMRDGDFVVFASPGAATPPVEVVTTVPEIFVVGRRTQDVDIRRSEDDIQPYQVEGAHDIETSDADNVDDLLRSRLSSNAEILSPLQNPSGQLGSTRSEINLHGLGASQTLVLVDGQRMPSLPTSGDGLLQPDLNGIPLSAIDRVETLTSTAGGIYGPGATGGVVNIILKHDYRGADLSVSYGETQRGDASRAQIDGRIGFTPDDGQTDISLSFSRAVTSPLTISDRSYAEQSLQLNSPDRWAQSLSENPLVNGVFISSTGGPLALKPAYGGASLASSFTFLPLGYQGLASDGGARLSANAGTLPEIGSPGSLESNPSVTSLLFNVRHHFSDQVEAYLDVIDLHNDGHADTSRSATVALSPTAPDNPFNQYVNLIFPLPGFDASTTTRTHMLRVASGLILTLPFDWKADINYSGGIASQDTLLVGSTTSSNFYSSIYNGTVGQNGRPALNPLGDWATFVAALQAYRLPAMERIPLTNHLADGSLRLAGPIAELPAGPVTLSLLAEQHQEEVSASTSSSTNLVSNGTRYTSTPRLRQGISSLYAELRAPLVPTSSSFLPLRGLEGQLAIRYDGNTSIVPANFAADAVNASFVTARQSAIVYTAGVKIQPLQGFMLRSSVATGVLPPAIDQLGSNIATVYGTGIGDPERGGRQIGSEQPVEVLSGGSISVQPEDSRSISVGAVIEPGGSRGPRLSVDFTRIDKTHEISDAYDFNTDYFLTHEAVYPGRVVRAPLTPADAALGFTGGVITQINTTSLNIGSTVVEAVDFSLDDTISLPVGQLKVRAMGTWQPVFKQRSGPAFPWIDLVGYNDGPLEWRGNGTVEWDTDRLSVGINAEYYDSYKVVASSPMSPSDVFRIVSQGSTRIPSQTYFDFFSTYRFNLPSQRFLPRTLELSFGIEDLFDTAPPVVTGYANYEGYSSYGDPRRRRFDLRIASRF